MNEHRWLLLSPLLGVFLGVLICVGSLGVGLSQQQSNDRADALLSAMQNTASSMSAAASAGAAINYPYQQAGTEWGKLVVLLGSEHSALAVLGTGGYVSEQEHVAVPALPRSARVAWQRSGQALQTVEDAVNQMQPLRSNLALSQEAISQWSSLLSAASQAVADLQPPQEVVTTPPWRAFTEAAGPALVSSWSATSASRLGTLLDATKALGTTASNQDYRHRLEAVAVAVSSLQSAATARQNTEGVAQKAGAALPTIYAAVSALNTALEQMRPSYTVNLWPYWLLAILGGLCALGSAIGSFRVGSMLAEQAASIDRMQRQSEKIKILGYDLERQATGFFNGSMLDSSKRMVLAAADTPLSIPVDVLNKVMSILSSVNKIVEEHLLVLGENMPNISVYQRNTLITHTEMGKHLKNLLDALRSQVVELTGLSKETSGSIVDFRKMEPQITALEAEMDSLSGADAAARGGLIEAIKRAKHAGEGVQEISSRLSLLQHHAEEMHVLSANAAIEAAALGEPGRRFVLITRDMQRLSKNVSDALSVVVTGLDSLTHTSADTITGLDEQVSLGMAVSGKMSELKEQVAAAKEGLPIAVAAVEHLAKGEAAFIQTVVEILQNLTAMQAALDERVAGGTSTEVALSKVGQSVSAVSNTYLSLLEHQ